MNQQNRLTRRQVLTGAAAAAGAAYVIPSSAWGSPRAPAPSNRLGIGVIGPGGQGSGHLGRLLGTPEVQVTAVCDVDKGRLDRAKNTVEERYSQKAPSGSYKGCGAYRDFRELLARDDTDAVVIATPENWHSLLTIAAAKAGKDIYCEKPFAPTIAEGRAAADAVKRYRRILQVGSQERSNGRCRYALELVRSGRIGRVHTIRVNLPTDHRTCGPQPAEPVPAGFDYDSWLGPAPWAPYTRLRCHGNFRWILDYSDGELTDRGAHVGDLAQWGNGADRSGPVEIAGSGVFPREGLWNTAIDYTIHYHYASGVYMIITSDPPRGVKFEGDEGWLFIHVHGGATEAEPKSVLSSVIGPNDVHLYDNTNDHHKNWFNCIRTRKETIAPAEAGHRTASICHLGNIAMLLGRKLKWDPDKEQFINDDEANRMVGRAMRGPWSL
jgi:hypothetical protein